MTYFSRQPEKKEFLEYIYVDRRHIKFKRGINIMVSTHSVIEPLSLSIINTSGIKYLDYPATRYVRPIYVGQDVDDEVARGNLYPFFLWWIERDVREKYERCRTRNFDYQNQGLEAIRALLRECLAIDDLGIYLRSPLPDVCVLKGEKEIPLPEIELGVLFILAMLGDIATYVMERSRSYQFPFEGEAVILIEEIEMHLHPQYQIGLIDSISQFFPNCQFVISTNSPVIVSQVQPDRIFLRGKNEWYHPEASCGIGYNRLLVDLFGVDERPSGIK